MMTEIVWRRQKKRKYHIDEDNHGLWRCPSIDVNIRSRDFYATDALEL